MILRSEELKSICTKILPAVDSDGTLASETLQLKVVGNLFSVSVTNREYFVTATIQLEEEENFNATVSAGTFLKLISQITTDTITLVVENNCLVVRGNGTYKLPMIFEEDSLLELKPIDIENETVSMRLSGEVLLSILQNNSKELQKVKENIVRPIQRYYYVDEHGCITFSSGACVNNFELEKPVKFLLSAKVVKLFKLLGTGEVLFTLGHDFIGDDTTQTKVRFETPTVTISAILSCDDSMILGVPVGPIRSRANSTYNYSVVFNKDELLQAINRFMLFVDKNSRNDFKSCAVLTFQKDGVTIEGKTVDFDEFVYYTGMDNNINGEYTATIDLVDIKYCLDSYTGAYATFNFGDGQAFVLANGNIKNVIPEIDEDEY